jgi:hypothetical protein
MEMINHPNRKKEAKTKEEFWPEYEEREQVEAKPGDRWRKGVIEEVEGPWEDLPEPFLYTVEFRNGEQICFEGGGNIQPPRKENAK